MKKKKEKGLGAIADVKVFLLFLLDNIRYPIDRTTLMNIIADNVDELSIDYEQCLTELADSEHILFDQFDGEKYYMIAEKGRLVSAELYESIDPDLRERSVRSANKHVSLSNDGTKVSARVEETASKRFKVILEAYDKEGEVLSLSVTVATRMEAELIKANYESKPGSVYRGLMFSLTGKLEFFS
jgi:hypothetical protein